MKTDLRRFAPLGLYLAGLAALTAAGLYIVMREMNIYLQISLALIPIGLAIFALLDPERVRQALTGRQARHGSNALILLIAVVGIVLVVNYLAMRNTRTWDLTENKAFTLAPETLNTLNALQEPVTAQAFFTARAGSENAKTLLEQYKLSANDKFDYVFIDPEENPLAAEQAKITKDGTIVLVMAGRQEPVTFVSEKELTGGLVRLINPEKRMVYFMTGHGERSLDDSTQTGYSAIKAILESKNYSVLNLNLLAENKIPEDAKVIVIAGPTKPLAPQEIGLLNTYLEQGGALVPMLEPPVVTEFGDLPDPLAEYLDQIWGIQTENDIVVDLTSAQPFAPYAAQYGASPITEKMAQMTTQYPTVRSARVKAEMVEGVSQVELVLTAQQSWAETTTANLNDANAQVGFDEGIDTPGPVSLAVQAENFTNQARLVMFGDVDFANNANFSQYANGDILINAIDWAAGQEQLIELTPKEQTTRTLLPPQATIMNLLFLVTVIILPVTALVAGIVIWVQRRRRG